MVSANKIYELVCEIVKLWEQRGIAWTIENPTNSLMWKTSFFVGLKEFLQDKLQIVDFQMCMHGGTRNKRTTLWASSMVDLSSLALMCDGDHVHASWKQANGGYATAEERRYPQLFCRRVAKIIKDRFVTEVKAPVDNSEKVYVETQPRRGMQEVVSEFKEVVVVKDCSQAEVDVARASIKDRKAPLNLRTFKLGEPARVLDIVPSGGQLAGLSTESSAWDISVGVRWSPMEFLQQARKVVHPFDREVKVPQKVAQAWSNQAWLGVDGIIRKRREVLAYYRRRSEQLQWEEDELHKRLHPDVAKVVADKRIRLFAEMLWDIEYDDQEVSELLITGVRTVGELPRIGIWKPDSRPPRCSIRTLWMNAEECQKSALQYRGDHEEDETIWKSTLEEAEDGGIRGPISKEELSAKVGPNWIAARRFPIIQGVKMTESGPIPKVRAIDDFSEFGINSAFGVNEKPGMLGLEQVVSWTKARCQSAGGDGVFRVVDTAGKRWETRLHESWTRESWITVKGRVADLKAAYKQLPRDPVHESLTIIAVKNPILRRIELFETLSLMFGQTAAVYSFLRFSRAIAAISAKLLDIVVVEFFDDFTQVEAAVLAESSQEALETMIKLLGWKIADAPDKRKPFESKFISLGVEVDVGETSLGRVKVRNKPGRVESIASQVDELVKAGGMRSREAASLLGKVRFAEGQIYGRISAPLTYILSRWSGRAIVRLRSGLGWNVLKSGKPRWPADPGVHKLSKETVSTMLLTVESLQRARPRLLGPPSEAPQS